MRKLLKMKYRGRVITASSLPTSISSGIWSLQDEMKGGWTTSLVGKFTAPLLDGTLILDGHGLMVYSVGFGSATVTETNFVVPVGVTKLRAIAIGAGGGASGNQNVVGAQAGSGVEAFINVTPGETLIVGVGRGGVGSDSGTPGAGGSSYIKRGGTTLIQGNGGASTLGTNTTSGLSRSAVSYDTSTGTVTIISIGRGGTGGAQSYSPSSDFNAISESVALSGAIAHAGGGGGWQDTGSSFGTGIGFGGGGGFAGDSAGPTGPFRSGGIYGFQGGSGSSGSGIQGAGPVGGWTNGSGSGTQSGASGGGGGSFGGSGVDGWTGGYGAGGLVRLWWASSLGDPLWINTGSNYGV